MSERIGIKYTGAIGDAVIALGLIPGLREAGFDYVTLQTNAFIAPLWKGLEGAQARTSDTEDQTIDTSAYLVNRFDHPHAHLVQLLAIEVKNQGGPEILPSPDDVMLALTKDELSRAADKIAEISSGNGDLPVLIIAPDSTTKNRNLPRGTLQEVVTNLQGRAVSCVMRSDDSDLPEGALNVWGNLRDSAAMLAVADAVVAVDSALFHMVNAVLQGSTDTMKELGLNTSQDKVVAVLGSSSENSATYNDNQVLVGTEAACDIKCGAHGYKGLTKSRLEGIFSTEFYPSGDETDESLCQFPDYAAIETAGCMQSITSQRIINAVMRVVGNPEDSSDT